MKGPSPENGESSGESRASNTTQINRFHLLIVGILAAYVAAWMIAFSLWMGGLP